MFLVNGQPEDKLSLHDRGLHYGDGLFETIAVDHKRPLNWDRHYQRLQLGCKRLHIDCPASEELLAGLDKLEISASRSVLKLMVTRGPGGRGYRFPETETSPTVIHGLYEWPEYPVDYPQNGVVTRFCNFRLGNNSGLAGIKHMNRLEQVLARSEWHDPEIAEGIMLDTGDRIIAGTMSNLFLVRNHELLTPDLDSCGVAGVTRACILDAAASLDIPAATTTLYKDDLFNADELYMGNPATGEPSL